MIAVVFPGQGSQKPGMGQDLFENFASAREVFELVSEATGVDCRKLCFETPEDELRRTDRAQLALYTTSMAAYSCLKAEITGDPIFAGHSIGEYAAVVASGAQSLAEGAKLVQIRGNLMASCGTDRPGTMAAVLGLEREVLEEVCRQASGNGTVVVANDNCPGQLVISGDVAAVEEASKRASEAGAKRVLPLNVSGAFHSPLMLGASQEMGRALQAVPWSEQKFRVIANVTADVVEHGREWAELLERQLVSPVRWTESVQCMEKLGVTTVIECGVGEVLCGLIKRTTKEIRTLSVSDSATLETTLDALKEEAVNA